MALRSLERVTAIFKRKWDARISGAKYKGSKGSENEEARTDLLCLAGSHQLTMFLCRAQRRICFSKALVMETATLPRSSLVSVLCRGGLTVGHVVTKLGSLAAVGVLRVQTTEARWQHLTMRKKAGVITWNGMQAGIVARSPWATGIYRYG